MNTVARACALATLLGGTVSALPSDALLDSLQLAALEHEKADRLDERDKTEVLLELLARQRVVADSAPEIPQRRLADLDRNRSERAARETSEENSRRKPPNEVARFLGDSTVPQADTSDRKPPAPSPATPPSKPAAAATTCPGGPVRFRWIEPSARSPTQKGAGTLDVKSVWRPRAGFRGSNSTPTISRPGPSPLRRPVRDPSNSPTTSRRERESTAWRCSPATPPPYVREASPSKRV